MLPTRLIISFLSLALASVVVAAPHGGLVDDTADGLISKTDGVSDAIKKVGDTGAKVSEIAGTTLGGASQGVAVAGAGTAKAVADAVNVAVNGKPSRSRSVAKALGRDSGCDCPVCVELQSTQAKEVEPANN